MADEREMTTVTWFGGPWDGDAVDVRLGQRWVTYYLQLGHDMFDAGYLGIEFEAPVAWKNGGWVLDWTAARRTDGQ